MVWIGSSIAGRTILLRISYLFTIPAMMIGVIGSIVCIDDLIIRNAPIRILAIFLLVTVLIKAIRLTFLIASSGIVTLLSTVIAFYFFQVGLFLFFLEFIKIALLLIMTKLFAYITLRYIPIFIFFNLLYLSFMISFRRLLFFLLF